MTPGGTDAVNEGLDPIVAATCSATPATILEREGMRLWKAEEAAVVVTALVNVSVTGAAVAAERAASTAVIEVEVEGKTIVVEESIREIIVDVGEWKEEKERAAGKMASILEGVERRLTSI